MSEINQEIINQIKNDILDALEQVIDPELGIDIINLGLVYGIDLEDDGHCVVTMTLTTVGCPLADIIMEDVKKSLLRLEHVKKVTVNLVWTPLWTKDKMSRYARMALGIR
ncbi:MULTISPECIES: metal-sulfur cluster assembly factor [unclassified Granulicatella]|uniref:metal-sulfur cluster assembly factor n=1 Tax=unclassified Granulicatella TaxID=2630493 RepID=UPI0010738433|nr:MULTISPECIES: metal-sulfur cluster assembly factor [unclassified Granulicatella]MBF0781015.1 metal-sulfur cluster assembly factor [Granulicatella sp. 19428wC4_WM01]TFU92587.1 metal-sulfur cluster assembly factor [Granulicatella sp. WM01]